MAKPSKTAGHLYRAAFSLITWIVVFTVPFMAPASFVRSRASFPILLGVYLLAVSFTLVTIALWLVDRVREK